MIKTKYYIIILLCFSSFIHAQQLITDAAYWFDSDISNIQALAVTPAGEQEISESIDVSSLDNGLHTLHIRLGDENGLWSCPVSRFFITYSLAESTGSNEITSWEYWFDNQIAEAQQFSLNSGSTPVLVQDLDVSGLENGLHTLHFRFSDSFGNRSSAVSRFFIVSSTLNTGDTPFIDRAEYWYDNDVSERIQVDLNNTSQATLVSDIDVTSLNQGLHTLHIRFYDSSGKCSSAVSRFFINYSVNGVSDNAELTAFQYWIDQGNASVVEFDSPGAEINYSELMELSTLADGLHTLTFRFRDSYERYSSAVSRFFIKTTAGNTGQRLLNGYRYWFNDSIIVERDLETESEGLILLDTVDMRLIPKGEHMFHMQFRDNSGMWSSVISDTVEKLSYPYALLSASRFEACLFDSIEFSAQVVDADTITWSFGDGRTGNMESSKHAFEHDGEFNVSAIVEDTAENISFEALLSSPVTIHMLPVIDLGSQIDLCFGDATTLTGPSGMTSYTWSDGSDLESLVINTGGKYYLVVQDATGCVNSDTVNVLVHALPVIDMGSDKDICFGDTFTLTGPEGMQEYRWNTGSSESELVIDQSGSYSLLVTDVNNCSNADTVDVYVHDLPVVDLGNDFELTNDESATLDAGPGFSAYYWNNSEGSQTYEVSQAIQGLGDHVIQVLVEDAFGCQGSDTLKVTIKVTGIFEGSIDEFNISVYPNPVTDFFRIDWNDPSVHSITVSIVDLNGKILVLGKQINPDQEINIERLSPGSYLLLLDIEGQRVSVPLVKK